MLYLFIYWWKYNVPFIVAAIVFMLIGLYMMGLVVEGRRREIQPRKERFFTYINMHVSNVLASKFIEGKLDNPSSEGIIYGLHRNSIHKYKY